MFPWILPQCGPCHHQQCPSCPHLPSQLPPLLRASLPPGFRRKEFRGKLAIAITANFINRNTTAEAKVEEISGVAFIFNQKFFQELREATGGCGCLREAGLGGGPRPMLSSLLCSHVLLCVPGPQPLRTGFAFVSVVFFSFFISCLCFYMFVLPPSSP